LFVVRIDSKTWKHSYQLATAVGIFTCWECLMWD